MSVSRSGYYKWLNRLESKQTQQRQKWTQQIRDVYDESRQLYGSPKISKRLQQKGVSISERTVSRIMKQEGIRSRTVRKYKQTTNSKHSMPVHENLLGQDFSADAPNQKWVTDITYIPTREGWLYLASVMDLYSRKIVGWHMGERMDQRRVSSMGCSSDNNSICSWIVCLKIREINFWKN
jgi:transposase InsO family protein